MYKEIKSFFKSLFKIVQPITIDNNEIEIQFAKEGESPPDILLPDQKGGTVRLSDLKGKVILVDFWASWCGPCVMMLPTLQELYRVYNERGFEIFGVSLDDDLTRFLDKSSKLPWVNGCELKKWDNKIGHIYKVYSIPRLVLIGKDYKILKLNIESRSLNDLENLIKSLI